VAAPLTKCREASEAAQAGWSLRETVSESDHPGRSNKEASRHFLDVAPTPPHRGGDYSPLIRRLVAAAAADAVNPSVRAGVRHFEATQFCQIRQSEDSLNALILDDPRRVG